MNSFVLLDDRILKDNTTMTATGTITDHSSLSLQINQCLNQLEYDENLDIPGEDHIV